MCAAPHTSPEHGPPLAAKETLSVDDMVMPAPEVDREQADRPDAPSDLATRSMSGHSEDEYGPLASSRNARRLPLCTGALIPGTPYRLRRWLGDGGMGAVFEAEHIDIERRLAVKLLHARSSRKEWVTQAFRNEARASGRIGSPHIVEILDFKELEDGRLLIAMEFLDGETLRDVAKRQRLLGPRLLGIARQICKGLHAAHKAGIVHRDVKPENIMLIERDGRHDFVKVLDFGVAHILEDESTNRMVGTVHFMAPEVSWGQSDARTDVYALGCLLYEQVCGHPVFDGLVAHEIVQRHLSEQPVLPSKRVSHEEVSSAFDSIIMRCLHKDADERYQTMAELEAALCELQIEHGWVGSWHDPEAPDIEPHRRAQIEAGLAQLQGKRRSRAWSRIVVLGVLLTGVTANLVPRQEDDSAIEFDRTEELASHAQAAAAQFYFVYPPYDEPQRTTAYQHVLALEALGHDMGRERAATLRRDFADTLVRLGDRYWDFDAARPFAHEYYASALMFIDDEHARMRLGITLLTLERLRAKAERGDFSEHELLISETLAALAQPEPEERLEKLAVLQGKSASLTVTRAIDEVLTLERRSPRPRSAGTNSTSEPDRLATAKPLDAEPPTGETEAAETGSMTPEIGSEDLAPTMPSARPRAAKASALSSRARQARRDGDTRTAQTLFHQALAADRRNLEALDGLAAIAFSEADYTTSVNYLERATRVGPGSGARWVALGDAYFKTLRYDDARQSYDQARVLGSTVAIGRIAKVDRKLGRDEAALSSD